MKTSPASSILVGALTPRGRGAVAVIRVVGDYILLDELSVPIFRPANRRAIADQPLGSLCYGAWGREAPEDVVACRIDDRTLEICCHGGDRAVERILRDWIDLGARLAPWPELSAATASFLAAEIEQCLRRAITWRAAEWLLRQSDGRLLRAYQGLCDTEWSAAGRQEADEKIRELMVQSAFGIHLSQPWTVVITGPPNAGKSSLINALLGYQRAIVFNQPGTTRDVVTAVTAFEGWPVLLIDTAGLRIAGDSLEAAGIERAWQQLRDADLVIELIDLGESEAVPWISDSLTCPTIIVGHKCDLPHRHEQELSAGVLRVSSQTGAGVPDLQREIIRRLVPAEPVAEAALPLSVRQAAQLRLSQQALNSADETMFRTEVRKLLTGEELP